MGDFSTEVLKSFDYKIGVNAPRTDPETMTITINSMDWFINNQPARPGGRRWSLYHDTRNYGRSNRRMGSNVHRSYHPFNIVLRDLDPPQTIVLNSFTGDYAARGK